MEEETKKDAPADRDLPLIATSSQGQRIIMGAFFIAALGALILVFSMDSGKNQEQPLVTHEEVAFKTSSTATGPYIKPETSPPPVNAGDGTDPLALQRQQMMQAEALRMAAEQQKKMQKRLHSPQMIFDQSSPTATSPSSTRGSVVAGAGSSLTEGADMGDANVAFAAQAASQGFETSRAVRMRNLDTLIPQGTMIGGILETAIQSDLPGMVRAIVSEDIYSFDGSKLIIPKGSKLVGQYRSGLVRGQSRVFVIWNRLLRNDGVTISLGSYGTDDLGRSGLDGRVDTHFFERFGASFLLSMIDTSLQIIANNSRDNSSATVALETGNDFSRAAEIALENSVGIPPTVHVDQGKRIKVFVSKDLDFSQVMAKTADAGPL